MLRDILAHAGVGGGTALPADAMCDKCTKLFRTHPAVVEAMARRQAEPSMQEEVRKAMQQGTFQSVIFCDCDQRWVRLRERAHIPHSGPHDTPRTFGNFEVAPGTEAALLACRAFAEGETPHHVLTLVGDYGTGKTHLLEAIGRRLLERGHGCRYAYVPDLLQELRATMGDASGISTQEVLWGYQAVPTLLLDDAGAEKPTEWTRAQLTQLIDQRYRSGGRLRLVVTTNLTELDMAKPDCLGERITSRLRDRRTGQVLVVTMEARSYRS